MAVPKWLKDKTPQEKGRRYEKKLAKKLGVKAQPGSGAFPFYKEDIELDKCLIQVKHTGKKQFTLKADDLKTLVRSAVKIGKAPIMIVKLGGREWAITPWDKGK
ncbi:hypothetical protein LCGC14_1657830 [marine sediment metagenome]|uniref:Holliday junction resolvase n=1 Tax=marine sediment metagenome TaxID=412755 RepID=A0A0F9IHE6_9ZZZZ